MDRIKITKRKALISKFLGDQKKLDIETELSMTMNTYNNTIHNNTNHTPFEVFYSNNNDLFSEVYNNIIQSYNKAKRYYYFL